MYFFRTPRLFKFLYPEALWHGDREKKKIYLTFDDGPVPEASNYILDVLSDLDVKATFFCVGENIKKYPEVFIRILDEKHGIGNHTFNHLNGWKVSDDEYLKNIQLCDEVINDHSHKVPVKLFRPPYGKIRKKTIRRIKNSYKIIMWDVLSYDFSMNVKAEKCLEKSLKHTRNGSIIIFHDSIKSIGKNKLIISQFIQHFKNKNYDFCKIEDIYMKS